LRLLKFSYLAVVQCSLCYVRELWRSLSLHQLLFPIPRHPKGNLDFTEESFRHRSANQEGQTACNASHTSTSTKQCDMFIVSAPTRVIVAPPPTGGGGTFRYPSETFISATDGDRNRPPEPGPATEPNFAREPILRAHNRLQRTRSLRTVKRTASIQNALLGPFAEAQRTARHLNTILGRRRTLTVSALLPTAGSRRVTWYAGEPPRTAQGRGRRLLWDRGPLYICLPRKQGTKSSTIPAFFSCIGRHHAGGVVGYCLMQHVRDASSCVTTTYGVCPRAPSVCGTETDSTKRATTAVVVGSCSLSELARFAFPPIWKTKKWISISTLVYGMWPSRRSAAAAAAAAARGITSWVYLVLALRLTPPPLIICSVWVVYNFPQIEKSVHSLCRLTGNGSASLCSFSMTGRPGNNAAP